MNTTDLSEAQFSVVQAYIPASQSRGGGHFLMSGGATPVGDLGR